MTFVKICGLTDPGAVTAALDAGADAIGFVLAPGGPRSVTLAQANALAAPARGRAHIVAVMVNPGDDDLERTFRLLAPTVIQLHGTEGPRRIDQVRALTGAEVWKALPIGIAADLAAAQDFQDTDRLVLDARPPAGANRTGGHGVPFDWGLLEGWRAPALWLLSGGLTSETVAAALARTGAPGVDVSSGVEASPGVKDPLKIAAFIRAARAAQTPVA